MKIYHIKRIAKSHKCEYCKKYIEKGSKCSYRNESFDSYPYRAYYHDRCLEEVIVNEKT